MWDSSVSTYNQMWQAKKLQERVLQEKDQEQLAYTTQEENQSFESLITAKLQTQSTADAQVFDSQQLSQSLEDSAQTQMLSSRSFDASIQTRMLANQSFESQLVTDKVFTTQVEAKWLNQGWDESKEQGEMLAKTGLAKAKSLPEEMQEPEDVRQKLQPAPTGARVIRSVREMMQQQTVSGAKTDGSKSQNNTQAAQIGEKSSVVKEQSFDEVVKKEAKNAPEGAVSSGTQSATKEDTKMSAFFSMQSNTPKRGGRQWRDESDEIDEVAAAASNRMGALVEAQPTDYKNVAVQETLMPRLMELIQRLNAMGHSWARVVVPVDANTQVIVRFNTNGGRVKIHLTTPSGELTSAMREGWGELTRQAGEHGILLDEPTFDSESPSQA